jgi:murein DD-endopeptidase MepM/ murein hydrolase activator NlpD
MRAFWLVGFLVGCGLALAAGPAHAAPAGPAGTVVSPKVALNVRSGPAVWSPRVRTIPNGSTVALVCQVRGQRTTEGSVNPGTDVWNRLADGTYVSDAWIRRAGAVPACGTAPAVSTVAPVASGAAVASGAVPLNARTGPAREHRLVAALPHGTALAVVCQQSGQRVQGTVRLTEMWDRLANGTYVSDAYVQRAATPPSCGALVTPASVVTPATGPWRHPLPGFPASNSFRTARNPSHIGVDIMAFIGTPIRAAAAGRVVEVVCNVSPGWTCDRPGSASVRGCGWYVKLQHAGGLSTLYCHMVRRAPVAVGQEVAAGQVIGYVGSSGNSSAPHLHFEVHVNAPPTGPWNAIDPIPFMRAQGVAIDRR